MKTRVELLIGGAPVGTPIWIEHNGPLAEGRLRDHALEHAYASGLIAPGQEAEVEVRLLPVSERPS